MNHALLMKRGCRNRSGVLSRRGPGTSKSHSDIRMHSSAMKKERIEPIVLKETKRTKIGGRVVFEFRGKKFPNVREANNHYIEAKSNNS